MKKTQTVGTAQTAFSEKKAALDFSKLFGQEKQAPKTPVDAFKEGDTIKVSSENSKAVTGLIGGLESIPAFKLEKRARTEHESRTEAQRICREYQANTAKSQLLQSEILKGLKLGEDVYSLFLKAVETISLMTGNSLFYSQAEKDLIAIYGAGLREKPALWLELEAVQGRLQKLREAVGRETDPDSQERIRRAITAHEARAGELGKLISQQEREEIPQPQQIC